MTARLGPGETHSLKICDADACRDRPHAPFRCLEAQYRRELVRVYLTNVETLARKFVDEKREALLHLRSEDSGFRTFWGSLDPKRRRQLATTSGETVLKVPPWLCSKVSNGRRPDPPNTLMTWRTACLISLLRALKQVVMCFDSYLWFRVWLSASSTRRRSLPRW